MNVVWRDLGVVGYASTWRAMQDFTTSRTESSADELWVLQHPPVFTQGRAGKNDHLIAPGDIPVINSDRGGQVTYHGPGQVVLYVLLDLKRINMGPRELVRRIECGVIRYLKVFDINGERIEGAPGIYVAGAKLAALGLRIRNACSYHGLALNVAMDLEPFKRINPCGYPGLGVTQLSDQGGPENCEDVAAELVPIMVESLYDSASIMLRTGDGEVYPQELIKA